MAKNTTIQVSKETAERLSVLRSLGLTYDDAINLALDRMPPEELKKLFLEWQTESFATLLRSGAIRLGKRSKP